MENQNQNNPEGFEMAVGDIKNEITELLKAAVPTMHKEILDRLLEQIRPINFREQGGLTDENEKLSKQHYIVICVEQVLNIAQQNNWGICKNNHFIYLYNGEYWSHIDNREMQSFLGKAAEKMGINRIEATYYQFSEHLYKQIISSAYLQKPEKSEEIVLINFKNGTFEISPDKQILRSPRIEDFITYQLPFEYNPDAKAPLFEDYLNTVQPDIKCQYILAEYLGYLFIKPSRLKLEKTLLLYGSGANGKSVFFEIVYALLGGDKNVSNYSLRNLTNETGYWRGMLSNKILNYASEISGKLETSIFKQLVSGEPVEARLPYGEPFTLKDYAKLIFNCNELPKDVEQSHAYFRRFLIVPFEVTIPEDEQDKDLHKIIIENELSGVFNWVQEGLQRLLIQKGFTKSEAVEDQIRNYKMESDSVQMFFIEDGYEKCTDAHIEFKDLFEKYQYYCEISGFYPCSKKSFGIRLRNIKVRVEKKRTGMIVYVKKVLSDN